jgi:hypothetical protein
VERILSLAKENTKATVSTESSLIKRITLTGGPVGTHLKNTLRLVIKGKKTSKFDEIILEDIIMQELGIPQRQIQKLYNLGKPNEWFVTILSEELFKSLHMREIAKNSSICSSILLLDVERNGQRGVLKWVPPTFTKETVNTILDNLTMPNEPKTAVQIGKSDKWAVDFCPMVPTEELPHYIEVEAGEEKHTLLLQLEGRRTVCPLCKTTRHGPMACRNQYIRERDNIHLDREGQYIVDREDEELSTTDDETTTRWEAGDQEEQQNEWHTVNRKKKTAYRHQRAKNNSRINKAERTDTIEQIASPTTTYAGVLANKPDRTNKRPPGEFISPPSPKSTKAGHVWETT